METASENVESTKAGDGASEDTAETGHDASGDESETCDGGSQGDNKSGGDAPEEEAEPEGTESVDANSSAPASVANTAAAMPPVMIRTQEDMFLEIAAFECLSSLGAGREMQIRSASSRRLYSRVLGTGKMLTLVQAQVRGCSVSSHHCSIRETRTRRQLWPTLLEI